MTVKPTTSPVGSLEKSGGLACGRYPPTIELWTLEQRAAREAGRQPARGPAFSPERRSDTALAPPAPRRRCPALGHTSRSQPSPHTSTSTRGLHGGGVGGKCPRISRRVIGASERLSDRRATARAGGRVNKATSSPAYRPASRIDTHTGFQTAAGSKLGKDCPAPARS